MQQAQNAQLKAELAQDNLASDYQSAQIKLQLLTDPLAKVTLTRSGVDAASEMANFNLPQSSPSDTSHNAALALAQVRASSARLRNLAETVAPSVNLNLRQLLSNRITPPPSIVQQRGWSSGISLESPWAAKTSPAATNPVAAPCKPRPN